MKFMFLLLVGASLALAQSKPSAPSGGGPGCTGTSTNWPANYYPCDPQLATGGINYRPDDQLQLVYLAYETDSNGVVTPIPNYQFTLYCYPTLGSGWHSHDTLSSNRPQPIYIWTGSSGYTNVGVQNCQTGIPGITSGNGTASFTFQLPGYAGWYTFWVPSNTHVDPSGNVGYLPERGVNYYAKYAVYEGLYTGSLTAYPDNTSVNYPQLAYVDQNHQGQSSRFFLPLIINQIQNASSAYDSDLVNELNVIPITGLADNLPNVFRGSLYDGGEADNFFNYSPPYNQNWMAPEWEEHFQGTEADVTNPSINSNPAMAIPNAVYLLMSDFSKNTCGIGLYAPNTMTSMGVDGALAYWPQQSWIHFTCGNAFLPHSTTGHGQ